jgi:hypothetical protein
VCVCACVFTLEKEAVPRGVLLAVHSKTMMIVGAVCLAGARVLHSVTLNSACTYGRNSAQRLTRHVIEGHLLAHIRGCLMCGSFSATT